MNGERLQLRDGASVYTTDGEEIGHLDRVVLDPRTKQVTHLVVRHGILLAEDKIVRIDHVDEATEDRISLSEEVKDLDSLPPFEARHYVRLDQGEREAAEYPENYASPSYLYPLVGSPTLGYPGYPIQPYTMQMERMIKDREIPLREGAAVYSREGEQVGSVDQVFADADSGDITHILISRGLLFKTEKLVPSHWIEQVGEESVRLHVGKGMLEDLPDYEEEE